MAVYSMTGFGRGEMSDKKGFKVSVELSSVNRKQLDCNVSLPRELAACESRLQTLVGEAVKRGYVKGAVSVENTAALEYRLDMPALKGQVDALREAAAELNLKDDLTASSLLRMPEFLKTRSAELDAETVWPDVEKALGKALKKLRAMRLAEGEALEKDIRARLAKLRKICRRISRIAPGVPVQYKKLLEQRLAALVDRSVGIDGDVIAREVAVFADRCDVSEELTRLESHFDQAGKVLDKGGVCGRTLDFICQEMYREINTTGSKASNAEIARLVIEFKAGLEAVREQVQNIE